MNLRMECKYCGHKFGDGNPSIKYVEKAWKGAGKFAGTPEYLEEVTIDGGMFCCRKCLIDYLAKTIQ